MLSIWFNNAVCKCGAVLPNNKNGQFLEFSDNSGKYVSETPGSTYRVFLDEKSCWYSPPQQKVLPFSFVNEFVDIEWLESNSKW